MHSVGTTVREQIPIGVTKEPESEKLFDSVTRLGDLKVLGQIFCFKISPNVQWLWAVLKTSLSGKNGFGNILGNFAKIWPAFYFTLWSHCVCEGGSVWVWVCVGVREREREYIKVVQIVAIWRHVPCNKDKIYVLNWKCFKISFHENFWTAFTLQLLLLLFHWNTGGT